MTTSQHKLTVQSLSFGYYPTCMVFEGIEFEALPGSITAVLGPNGVGKSTLLKVLSGQLDAFSGDVQWSGRPIGDFTPNERARFMAWLGPSFPDTYRLTVRDYLYMGRFPFTSGFGFFSDEDHDCVARISRELDIERFLPCFLEDISSGERQRVHLARLFVQTPDVLLLDEPLLYLDLGYQRMFVKLVKQWVKDTGGMVIIVSHHLDMVTDFADQVVLIQPGGTQYSCGKPSSVISSKALKDVWGV